MTYFTQRGGLGERACIGIRVLEVFEAVAVASKNNDTVNLRLWEENERTNLQEGAVY